MQDDHDIARLLADYSAPIPSDEFLQRAMLRAAHAGERKQRRRWILTGFGSAVAAGLVLWLLGGVFGNVFIEPVEPGTVTLVTVPKVTVPNLPDVVMTIEEPRTINLVFAATEALPLATLTVSLPAGVELSGFPGQREVRWQTSLDEGRNLLPLTLIANNALDGVVLATLQHDNRDRTFRLHVATG